MVNESDYPFISLRTYLMKQKQNFIGQRFGKLLITDFVDMRNRHSRWAAICDCGNTSVAWGSSLKSGHTNSCGCLRVDVGVINGNKRTTHGMTKTSTYECWKAMRGRCEKTGNIGYKHYGGRGISVCDRWSSFESFLADMGVAPIGMSLDRIDVNGNYEPNNCKWSTDSEQCRNKRDNRLVTAFGKTMPMAAWSDVYGVKAAVIRQRLNRSIDAETAVSMPVKIYVKRSTIL